MKSSNKATKNTTLLINARQQLCVSKAIDCYEKILQVTAYVIQFIQNCQAKCKNNDKLTAAEILRSTSALLGNLFLEKISFMRMILSRKVLYVKQI